MKKMQGMAASIFLHYKRCLSAFFKYNIKTNLMLSSMPLGALVSKKKNFIKLLQHYLYIIVNTTSCCAELHLGQT